MNHPLQCRCGKVRGYVSPGGLRMHALCYCKDCQAFAHFLGSPEAVLDSLGGTGIAAAFPSQVYLTQGLEFVACMSLSPRGLLRWYSTCCHTPMGNTPRSPKMPYIGLVHSCLGGSSPSLEESFGPVGAVLNARSATGRVSSSPWRNLATVLRLIGSLTAASLAGRNRPHPFFPDESGAPLRQPEVLTPAQRARYPGATTR